MEAHVSHTLTDRIPTRARLRALLSIAAVLLLGGTLLTATPALAAGIGTGAVSIKGPGSELVPGTTVEIRQDTCTGAPVWHTTTTSRPDAYGAFGIGLAPGNYCVVTLAVPAPYDLPANVTFTMEQRPGNWVTVWLPGPPPIVTGAVVAKDESGAGVNGVTTFIAQGACGTGGPGVWRNTTATSQWSTGGFGISLPAGTYCATAEGVPAGYRAPAPATVLVAAPSPTWITIWVTTIPITGNTDYVLPVNIVSGKKMVEFSCARCTGYTSVTAKGPNGASDLLVSEVGAYPLGRSVVGLLDWDPKSYTSLAITANAPWTLRVLDVSSARQVWSTATGTGDDVVVVNAPGSVATVSNHGAGYFSIWSRTASGELDLVASEVGVYWGVVPITAPALLQITSDGAWQIDIG